MKTVWKHFGEFTARQTLVWLVLLNLDKTKITNSYENGQIIILIATTILIAWTLTPIIKMIKNKSSSQKLREK